VSTFAGEDQLKAPGQSITVRRATLADKSAIFDFIRVAHEASVEWRIPDRWEWQYVENPCLRKSCLPIWIAVDETGSVVGQTCAMLEQVKIGGEIHQVGWSVDTHLLPQYRGRGIGYKLQKANDAAHDIFMSVAMTPSNRRIKAALGSVPLEAVPTFVKSVKGGAKSGIMSPTHRRMRTLRLLNKKLPTWLRWQWVMRAIARIVRLGGAWRDTWPLRGIDDRVRIVEVERFGEEMDVLWRAISGHFDAIVKRDRTYLNWKFVKQPHMNHTRFVVWRDDTVCGYLILRLAGTSKSKSGIIVDLFISPQDELTIRTLLAHAIVYFKGRAVEHITVSTTVKEYQKHLRRLGFKQREKNIPMLHCRLRAAQCEVALKPGSWFLSKADHDWDLPNS